VSDAAIVGAQTQIGNAEGLFPAPEGAATYAALEKLVRQKWIQPDESVVLFNTGSGLKYLNHLYPLEMNK
jgi:threonine synthase